MHTIQCPQKTTKGNTMIYKKLLWKLKIEQTEPHKTKGWMQVLRKDRQFLLHWWHSSCYLCYKLGHKPWMRKGRDWDYDKRNLINSAAHLWHRYYITITKSWWQMFVSDCCLTPTRQWFMQLYHSENKLIFNEMMMRSILYKTNTLSSIVIVLSHWNNIPRVDMSLHSDTLSWFRANQPLFFLLNVACLVWKQQIPIL